MDNPNELVNKVELVVTELMKFPNLKRLLALLSKSPKVRRFLELVDAVGRPQLVSPDSGETLPTSSSITVTFSVGNASSTYTVNIIDANGAVVHTCVNVPIDPNTLEGSCTIPAGTLGDGENFTIEVVTNGSSYTTIGWFASAVAV